MPVTRKSLLSGGLAVALLATSGYLTVRLRDRDQPAATGSTAPLIAAAAVPGPAAPSVAVDRAAAGYRYERLAGPDRTVVRDARGGVLATLTDGARTAVLAGPSRTFAEPGTTTATLVNDSWVRLMPQPWRAGAENEAWFRGWFQQSLGSTADDVLAIALQYLAGAPAGQDAKGVRVRGDASFGPLNPNGAVGQDLRLEQTDFVDYLGTAYTFADKVTRQPDRTRYGAFDCSGFVRMVYGYRSGYPMLSRDVAGPGLPRTANGLARLAPGVPVLPLTTAPGSDTTLRPASIDPLQPGDLVFFEIDARTGTRLDHTGIYLGLDTDGHPRYISSREEADGPTFGDKGGTARLDDNGLYAKGLRSAKRL
ncbi:NlpC/P60 family protein [Kitasatospora sp. NPDC048239]|uniref:NlpC/P60 family protein n=1 Tax=Kitasatospora sp. NPDC048239 TaxID=3364046 RepID=UPI003716FAB2